MGIVSVILLALLLASPAAGQISRLPHDSTPGDFFGAAVAIDGDIAVVGAPSEDACGVDSGAAYIFRRNPASGVWYRESRHISSSCEAGALFGRAVAVTGEVVVVAAGGESFADDRSAAAHIIERNREGEWEESQRLVPPRDDRLGLFAADVSANTSSAGPRILVVSSGDRVGARFNGAAYVYERGTDDEWTLAYRISPADPRPDAAFGRRGDISSEGIVIAASGRAGGGSGAVYIFEYDTASDSWLQRARLHGFGHGDLVVSLTDSFAVVGDLTAHRVTGTTDLLHRHADGSWRRSQNLVPHVTRQSGAFGSAAVIRGRRALVVGYDEQLDVETNIDRVVFVFEPDHDGRWRQRHVIDIGEVAFGASLAFDGRYALIGSVGDDISGAAYVVRVH